MNLKTGVSRKESTRNFPKNEHSFPPDRHTYVSGSKKCCFFSENLACYVFLKHPFWDPPFYFITDDINDLNACARKTLLRVKNEMRELTPHFKLWLSTADCAPDCWSSKSALKNPAHLLRVTEKNQFKDWYCFKVVYYQL